MYEARNCSNKREEHGQRDRREEHGQRATAAIGAKL